MLKPVAMGYLVRDVICQSLLCSKSIVGDFFAEYLQKYKWYVGHLYMHLKLVIKCFMRVYEGFMLSPHILVFW